MWSSSGALMSPISLAPSTGSLSLTRATGRSPWTGDKSALLPSQSIASKETLDPAAPEAPTDIHTPGLRDAEG